MIKKNINIIIPVVTLIIGGLIGYLIWGGTHDHNVKVKDDVKQSLSADEIWTCSMHPQIRMSEPGICPICEMDLIPLDNKMSNDDPTVLQMSMEAVKLAQIETFVVGSQTGSNDSNHKSFIEVDGTVELDERTFKSQTAHLTGRIEVMTVTYEGQYISAGQKIASIYSTDLLAASQELLTAVQYNDRVEGLKDAAIKKLKNWKISDSQIEQILSSGKAIETIDIYADHSGYVLSKKLSQGDYVKAGQSLYSLGSIGRVWLNFNVFESDIASVNKGDRITFTSSTIPNKEFSAKITYINPLLNTQSRTATVRAEIKNVNNQLKPGMLLSGKIAIEQGRKTEDQKTSINVPNSAILWTGDRSVVYVLMPDSEIPSYQFREVKVSKRSHDFSTIIEGLDAGEEVVTYGAFSIDAAAQLNNKMSMMNRNVSVKNDNDSGAIPSFVDSTPKEFKVQLDDLVARYLELKNALVATDYEVASVSAETLLKALEDTDMNLLKDEAHLFWMVQLKAIETHTKKIKDSEDVEEQRNQFDFLSQSLINSLKAFGTNDKIYYVQYCPMVKNNTGADWISADSVIKNPYFGDKMMKCGSIKLEIN